MRTRIRSHGVPGARFLDPAVLTRIGNLELIARTVVEGFISGLHRSPFLGLSLDFAAHRQYMPGDDLRKIDWKVYGRTDRYYIKEYEAETNANVFFAFDMSRSMAFASGDITKLDYARFLTACLAYLSADQRDRVGIATFNDRVVEHVPPSVRHRRLVLHALDRAEADGGGDLLRPLSEIAGTMRRSGLVVVVSDLYAPATDVLRALGSLRSRGADVLVFHVLDPAELDFPYEGPSAFEDLETGAKIPVAPESMRDKYLSAFDAHLAEMAKKLTDAGIDYEPVDTSVPLDHALFRYLSLRQRRLERKQVG